MPGFQRNGTKKAKLIYYHLPQRRKGRKEKHKLLSKKPLRSLRLCGKK
jgi:hypothetical protein